MAEIPKYMVATVAILLAGLFVIGLTACGTPGAVQSLTVSAAEATAVANTPVLVSASPSPRAGWNVVENPERGVAISVPGQWEVRKLDPVANEGFYFLADDPLATGGHEGALRVVSNGTWKGSQAEFAAVMMKSVGSNEAFNNVQLIEPVQMAAGKGFEIKLDIIAPKGAEEFEDMYWVFASDEAIMLDLACPLQYRSEYEGVFRDIAESFVILDPKSLASP
jgi:hypothetical protein